MNENALELHKITKMYGDLRVVDDVSLNIPIGSIYGLLGPNGAGKTTIIRIILEIIHQTSGTVTVLGQPSSLLVRDRIGYLPEEKGLYRKMTACSVIAYFATLKGMHRGAARMRAYELLERYGLGDFADERTEALSKGMGQKVQVLAAIAHEPEFVILDEPFSGLDPVNQEVLEEVIKDMSSDSKTILFSTHVMQHAERICDRFLVVAEGKKVFDGSLDEAKRTVRRRVRIETDGDITPLKRLDQVVSASATDANGKASDCGPHFEFEITDRAEPEEILKACFDNQIRLRRFDYAEPSLHEVFVSLVDDDARNGRVR